MVTRLDLGSPNHAIKDTLTRAEYFKTIALRGGRLDLPVLRKEFQDCKLFGNYILLNTHTREIYVGQTTDFYDRIQRHTRDSDKDWYNEFRFFGLESEMSHDQLNYLERELIALYREQMKYTIRNTSAGVRGSITPALRERADEMLEVVDYLFKTGGFAPFTDALNLYAPPKAHLPTAAEVVEMQQRSVGYAPELSIHDVAVSVPMQEVTPNTKIVIAKPTEQKSEVPSSTEVTIPTIQESTLFDQFGIDVGDATTTVPINASRHVSVKLGSVSKIRLQDSRGRCYEAETFRDAMSGFMKVAMEEDEDTVRGFRAFDEKEDNARITRTIPPGKESLFSYIGGGYSINNRLNRRDRLSTLRKLGKHLNVEIDIYEWMDGVHDSGVLKEPLKNYTDADLQHLKSQLRLK